MQLGIKDRRVIDAFTDGKKADGHKLSTDGHRLDGEWMGGRGIAEWSGGAEHGVIVFNDLGSRAAQTVQRAVRKAVPASWLAEWSR